MLSHSRLLLKSIHRIVGLIFEKRLCNKIHFRCLSLKFYSCINELFEQSNEHTSLTLSVVDVVTSVRAHANKAFVRLSTRLTDVKVWLLACNCCFVFFGLLVEMKKDNKVLLSVMFVDNFETINSNCFMKELYQKF